jgi:hypothetical protein
VLTSYTNRACPRPSLHRQGRGEPHLPLYRLLLRVRSLVHVAPSPCLLAVVLMAPRKRRGYFAVCMKCGDLIDWEWLTAERAKAASFTSGDPKERLLVTHGCGRVLIAR